MHNKILIFNALKSEMPGKNLIKKLSENNIECIVTGVGYNKAGNISEKIINEKITLIYNIGFCGTGDARLNIGDIIIANCVLYKNREIRLSDKYINEIQDLLHQKKLSYHTGTIQTFDHPVFENSNINRNCVGVDMEAYAIAHQAYTKDIPLVIMKLVSDHIPDEKEKHFSNIKLIMRIKKNMNILKPKLQQLYTIVFGAL